MQRTTPTCKILQTSFRQLARTLRQEHAEWATSGPVLLLVDANNATSCGESSSLSDAARRVQHVVAQQLAWRTVVATATDPLAGTTSTSATTATSKSSLLDPTLEALVTRVGAHGIVGAGGWTTLQLAHALGTSSNHLAADFVLVVPDTYEAVLLSAPHVLEASSSTTASIPPIWWEASEHALVPVHDKKNQHESSYPTPTTTMAILEASHFAASFHNQDDDDLHPQTIAILACLALSLDALQQPTPTLQPSLVEDHVQKCLTMLQSTTTKEPVSSNNQNKKLHQQERHEQVVELLLKTVQLELLSYGFRGASEKPPGVSTPTTRSLPLAAALSLWPYPDLVANPSNQEDNHHSRSSPSNTAASMSPANLLQLMASLVPGLVQEKYAEDSALQQAAARAPPLWWTGFPEEPPPPADPTPQINALLRALQHQGMLWNCPTLSPTRLRPILQWTLERAPYS